jgi:hypothetical protein
VSNVIQVGRRIRGRGGGGGGEDNDDDESRRNRMLGDQANKIEQSTH